jgi:hypothetical protein
MKTRLPVAVAFLSGFLMVVAFFGSGDMLANFSNEALRYMTIVAGFSVLLGVVSITRVSVDVVRRRAQDWPFKIILLLCLSAMTGFGVFQGITGGTVFEWLFDKIQKPMMATMFSMLAFFIASAAYRAFRARNVEATILLITAIVVMIGRVPMGQYIYDDLPAVANWIMMFPNVAVQRGIIIGAALGAASMSLRIILGIERTYMGRG